MPEKHPKTLDEAICRLLDTDAASERVPAPAPRIKRIELLRSARATVSEWREGRLTTEQAVARLDVLAKGIQET